MPTHLYGRRYADPENITLQLYIQHELHSLDYEHAKKFYEALRRDGHLSRPKDKALLGCNDRFYLLTQLCGRGDADHPWLFERCREVERDPDRYVDLWSRFHYKSTIITFAGAIQEILRNPEIKIAIFSVTTDIAKAFLRQIKLACTRFG